jgi:transcriptional regulator with XRE-family HTH domain
MYGNKIRLIRQYRGLNQEMVATLLGTSQNAYSKIENNQKKLTDDDLKQLGEILGVSAEDIKSPEPVIMIFNHNSENNYTNHVANTHINEVLLEQLTKQLEVKDRQLDLALDQIRSLTGMLQKAY